MSFWKTAFSFVSNVGIFLAKKNNPEYSALIDAGAKALKEKDFKLLQDKTTKFIISEEEKKIHEQLETQRKEREIQNHDPKAVRDITKNDHYINLKNANYKNFSPKYYTKQQILDADENTVITNNRLEYITCGMVDDVNFKFEERGVFGNVILKDNRIMRGGFGIGGVQPPNFICVGLKDKYLEDHGITKDQIKGYFVIVTDKEGRGKKVFGRSQIVYL